MAVAVACGGGERLERLQSLLCASPLWAALSIGLTSTVTVVQHPPGPSGACLGRDLGMRATKPGDCSSPTPLFPQKVPRLGHAAD